MGCAFTEENLAHQKDHFWNARDNVIPGVPSVHHLVVLIDVNACAGKRENGCTDTKVLSAYGCN